MNKFSKNVIQFLKGRAPPKVHGIYLINLTIIYIILSVLSQVFFPEQYSIVEHTISSQGSIEGNPQGYLFFNIGVFFIGIGLIPHALFIMEHIGKSSKVLSYISATFTLIGAIGFSLLGIFPLELELAHYIVATIAFSGFVLGGIVVFVSYLEKMITKHSCWEAGGFIFLHLFLILAVVAISVFPQIGGVGQGLFKSDWLYSFALWEWTLMISIVLWLVGMYFIISKLKKEINHLKENEQDADYFENYIDNHACFKKLKFKKQTGKKVDVDLNDS